MDIIEREIFRDLGSGLAYEHFFNGSRFDLRNRLTHGLGTKTKILAATENADAQDLTPIAQDLTPIAPLAEVLSHQDIVSWSSNQRVASVCPFVYAFLAGHNTQHSWHGHKNERTHELPAAYFVALHPISSWCFDFPCL